MMERQTWRRNLSIPFTTARNLIFALALPCATPYWAHAQGMQLTLNPRVGSAMPQSERNRRNAAIESILDREYSRLIQQIRTEDPNIATRDLTNGALYHLERGGKPADAEKMLRKLFSVQNMDSSSKDFGYIPWDINNSAVHDSNSIDFDMQAMGAIFIGFGNRFSSRFIRESRPHLQAALTALANHRVPVGYTNIYLMNTFNLLALGQYLDNDASLERGRRQWTSWQDYTASNGIHEFDSPTYYAVDLGDLTLAFRYIKDPAIHAQIASVLDYYFTDIANNFFLPGHRLAGPHSRDYNFLYGSGGIDFTLFVEGLLNDSKNMTDIFLEKADVIDNDRPGGYHPSPQILRQSTLFNRIVQSRWDEDTGRYRYVYLTPAFALGTTDGAYGAQDKLFTADYASSQPVITTSVVIDTSGEPYGLAKQADGTGHAKPTHLPTNLSSVQEKNTALLVYDLNPSRHDAGLPLTTNLLLPSTASEVLLDDTPVQLSADFDAVGHIGSVIAVRQENSCFAATIWHVDTLQGLPPSLHLKADARGLEHGVFRFVIDHGRVANALGPVDHLHVGVLVRMEQCADGRGLKQLAEIVRTATFTVTSDKSTWSAIAQLKDLQLALTEDLRKRLPITRTINGEEMPVPVFTASGKSITF